MKDGLNHNQKNMLRSEQIFCILSFGYVLLGFAFCLNHLSLSGEDLTLCEIFLVKSPCRIVNSIKLKVLFSLTTDKQQTSDQ